MTFDVFGTVVDWHGTVVRVLEAKAAKVKGSGRENDDWSAFAKEWRAGYMTTTRRVAAGGAGSLNVDTMHREILEGMLASERWAYLVPLWNEEERRDLNMVWHRLDGWPDSSQGLYALKKQYIIATLSNGNVRLLADMAKHANLPWDVIFSGELLGSYKPNPKTYLGAAHHLSVPPTQVAMVAAHILDLRAAASHGLRTVYVRRPTEDGEGVRETVKTRAEGGDVDVVVDSFEELAEVLGCVKN